MPEGDTRERDQMWKRIDSHGGRISDLERGLTEVKGQADENGRNVTELAAAVRRAEAATNQVHLDLNTMIGQGKAMKKIALCLSAVLVFIQIADLVLDKVELPL